jgi:signal transduction histidine kinase
MAGRAVAEVDVALEGGLRLMLDLVGAPGGAIFVLDPRDGRLARRAGVGSARPEADEIAPAAYRALHTALIAGQPAVADPSGPAAARELGALAEPGTVAVPLRSGGETLGALLVARPPRGPLDPDERRAVEGAAVVLALILRDDDRSPSAAGELRPDRGLRRLVALGDVARAVRGTAVDAGVLAAGVVSEARRLTGAPAAALVRPAGDGALVTLASEGIPGDAPLPGLPLVREALDARRPASDDRVTCLPLMRDEDPEPLAVLVVTRPGGRPFATDEMDALSGISDRGILALATAELVSELRREHAERRALAAALVEAHEGERRRIAEEIHDGPVQALVGLGLMLDAVRAELGRPGAKTERDLERAAQAARAAVGGLREAISNLHPTALEELGFAAGTRSIARGLVERGLDVELDVAVADQLPPVSRTVAFRIVQEALTNIGKHADARLVRVTARRIDGEVHVSVCDDGRGFDPDAVVQRLEEGHLGLPAMRQRAALVGGRVEIEAAPGRGTIVRLAFPLAEEGTGARPAR